MGSGMLFCFLLFYYLDSDAVRSDFRPVPFFIYIRGRLKVAGVHRSRRAILLNFLRCVLKEGNAVYPSFTVTSFPLKTMANFL
jgi:hypothetical protein